MPRSVGLIPDIGASNAISVAAVMIPASAENGIGIKQMQLAKFSGKAWALFGGVLSGA